MRSFERTALVMFLSEDWDQPPLGFTRQRLVMALSKRLAASGCPMLLVERPLCPFTTAASRPEKALEVATGRRGLRQIDEFTYLMTPIGLLRERLAWRIPPLARMNGRVVAAQVQSALRRLGFGAMNIVSWIFHPYQAHLLGVLGESLSVYECYDEYAAATHISRRQVEDIQRLERSILERADVVFTTSKRLYETRSSGRSSTYLVPNGVDFELFASAADGLQEPDDLRRIPHPRIGFIGKINRKLDLDLIDRMARSKPEWQIVLLGPCDDGKNFYEKEVTARFQSAKNVHFPGLRPLADLPEYLAGFDTCIIPYVREEITASIYPLKVNEYLAGGKPVVATDFADLGEFGDLVKVARSSDDFISAVEEALSSEADRELVLRRQEMASANSWDARAAVIQEKIAEALAAKAEREVPAYGYGSSYSLDVQ